MHHNNQQMFESICDQIKSVDPNGDSIRQSNIFKGIGESFHDAIKDDKLLGEIFDMFNARALEDEEFILSLVAVITSRQLDSFTINGKVIRHAMLSILQKNFQNSDNMKRDNMNKFYNSIKLLGEYFNKARLTNGSAINIIGQSMLNLINVELEKELRNICHLKDDGEFARLVLSQIALNGGLLKTRHKTEIEQVLLTIRKCNIELPSLSPKTRAFFHMTLDLYYSNYTNVGDTLEKLYKSYLVDEVEKPTATENGRVLTNPENGNIQLDKPDLRVVKKYDSVKSKPEQLKLEKLFIKKKEPFRTGPMSPQRSYRDVSLPRTGQISPQIHQRDMSLPRSGPPSPRKNQRDMSLPRSGPASPQKNYRDMSLPRNGPSSPQKNYRDINLSKNRSKSPQKSYRDMSLPRNGPTSPHKNYRDMSLPRTGQSSQTNYRDASLPRTSQNTTANNRFYSPSNRNLPQSSTSRYAQQSSMTNPKSPSSKFKPQHSSSPARDTNHRSSSQPPGKKLSPQELRSKNTSQPAASNGSSIKTSRSASAIRSPTIESTNIYESDHLSDSSHQNGTDDYVLRQQNSRSSDSSSTVVPAKYKINNSKVYFREENVENLTWHGDGSIVADAEGADESTSPKVNPYSSSFLNFLSSN